MNHENEIPARRSLAQSPRRVRSGPPGGRFLGGCAFALLLLATGLGVRRAAAYPPAPHYTLYGIVRDQIGATLEVQGADHGAHRR